MTVKSETKIQLPPNNGKWEPDGNAEEYPFQNGEGNVLTMKDTPGLGQGHKNIKSNIKPNGENIFIVVPPSPAIQQNLIDVVQRANAKWKLKSTFEFKTNLKCRSSKATLGTWHWGFVMEFPEGKVKITPQKAIWKKGGEK